MRIFAIGNNNISFKQNPKNTFSLGLLTGVESSTDVFVSNEFNKNQKEKADKLSSMVYDRFSKNYDNKIENIEKFANPYNKALTLNNLAHSYYQSGEIEKAGVVLASSFNSIDFQQLYKDEDIDSLIKRENNKNILEDFFYVSNNKKAKYFVVKALNRINSPQFLPIAEDICECNSLITSVNDKKTIYQAREFINKNYDLDLLSSYKEENDNYKNAVLNIVSKWGLEKHKKIAETLSDDGNIYIRAKAKDISSKLSFINQDFSEGKEVTDEKRVLAHNKTKLKTAELIEKAQLNESNNAYLDFIKLIGQQGFMIKHAQFVKPDEKSFSQAETIKAEAFLKIMLRGKLKPSYID